MGQCVVQPCLCRTQLFPTARRDNTMSSIFSTKSCRLFTDWRCAFFLNRQMRWANRCATMCVGHSFCPTTRCDNTISHQYFRPKVAAILPIGGVRSRIDKGIGQFCVQTCVCVGHSFCPTARCDNSISINIFDQKLPRFYRLAVCVLLESANALDNPNGQMHP